MKILSRNDLFNLVKSNPKQISAIVMHEFGKYDEVKEIVDLCKESLVLEMDDTTMIRTGGPTKEAVEKALSVDYDYVSCKLGVSRSSAIAFLVECNKTDSETAIKQLDSAKHFPNELVLKLGMDILGKATEPIREFFKQIAINKKWTINMVTKYFK